MPKNRLEAFSDGIIAIAITLLILEIHVPEVGSEDGALLAVLLQRLPDFAVYAISFAVCSVWWISHHGLIHDIHSVDRGLLWINNLFLMLIAFMPFPTGLLGKHPSQPAATAFYGLVCMLTGLSFWLMRWYASSRGLMNRDLSAESVKRRLRVSFLSPALYFLGTIISLRYPSLALLLYAAIPGFFAVKNLRGPAPSEN